MISADWQLSTGIAIEPDASAPANSPGESIPTPTIRLIERISVIEARIGNLIYARLREVLRDAFIPPTPLDKI
jgi:hypothetical protein